MIKQKLKRCWRSLTIQFNTLVASVLVLLPEAQASFPALQDYIPDSIYKWAMGIVIGANILIRFKTKTDLAER